MKHALFALMLLAVAPLAAAENNVQSAPSEVTVYPRGAQVTRLGSALLQAGEQTLVFAGLPAGLREDSLRLSVKGPAGTKVYGLTLRRAFGEAEALERQRRLREKLQELQDERDDLGDRINARKAEAEILKAVAAKDAARSGDAKSLAGLADASAALGRRLIALAQADRKDLRAQRDLDVKIKALQAEIDGQGGAGTDTRVAEADLSLPVPGAVTAELSYFVDAAGWSPRYDLRLRAADKEPKAELEFLAELSQQSGEDWNGVQLSLSTAQPTQDSQVPDPTQWWLDYQPEIGLYGAGAMRMAKSMAPAAPAMEAADMAAPSPARAVYAQVRDLGPATVFSVARKQSIPSDQSGHRVAINSSVHPVELGLVVVPRLSKAGYLEAVIHYQGPAPLLPGPAQLFRDSDLVGQADLAYTAPGEDLTLGFGQDEKVKAERIRVEQKGGEAGWLGSKDRRRYAWTLKVSNFHPGAREVEVREQLPRSRQDAIKVEALKLDPKPQPEDKERPGLLVWRLSLAAGESRQIQLGYEVRWPEGKKIVGLE